MSNYIVTGEQLTSIADAIRAKSGGESQLAFPAGFVSECGGIDAFGDYEISEVEVSLTIPSETLEPYRSEGIYVALTAFSSGYKDDLIEVKSIAPSSGGSGLEVSGMIVRGPSVIYVYVLVVNTGNSLTTIPNMTATLKIYHKKSN